MSNIRVTKKELALFEELAKNIRTRVKSNKDTWISAAAKSHMAIETVNRVMNGYGLILTLVKFANGIDCDVKLIPREKKKFLWEMEEEKEKYYLLKESRNTNKKNGKLRNQRKRLNALRAKASFLDES